MNSQAIPDISHEQAEHFIQGLKSKLVSFTTLQLVIAVRIIFSKVRSSFSVEHTHQLFTHAPSLFQYIFMGHWSSHDKNSHTLHLDEIVQELVDEDHREGRGIFKSEIEALGIVIIVLEEIGNFFKKFGIDPYPYTLTHELQQASQGETI
jgi:hypothetical protein